VNTSYIKILEFMFMSYSFALRTEPIYFQCLYHGIGRFWWDYSTVRL